MRNKYELTATIYDKRGNVISRATNSYIKTHPKQKELAVKCGQPMRQSLHAEVLAIIRCLKTNKKPFKIRVERHNKIGEPMLAKPCVICELAIKEAGIKFIEYTL